MYKTLITFTLITVALFSVTSAEASPKQLKAPLTVSKIGKTDTNQSLRAGDIDPSGEGTMVTCEYSRLENQYVCEAEDLKCKKNGEAYYLYWTATTTAQECHLTGGTIIAYL